MSAASATSPPSSSPTSPPCSPPSSTQNLMRSNILKQPHLCHRRTESNITNVTVMSDDTGKNFMEMTGLFSHRFYVKSKLADFRGLKIAIWIHFEVLNFDFHEFLTFYEAEIYQSSKFRARKLAIKGSFFQLLNPPKLISRKILILFTPLKRLQYITMIKISPLQMFL